MRAENKVAKWNIALIGSLGIAVTLGSLLMVLPRLKPKIHISGSNGEKLIEVYTTTEENANTWDISENNDGSITAILSEDGTLTISGTGAVKNWDYNDTTDWHSSENKINVEKVVIEEGITSIGKYAFEGCLKLKSIEIPSSVTEIGDDAFSNCISLTNIELPIGITSVKNYTFWGCIKLKSIKLPENLEHIGEWAFDECRSLTNIDIPNGVTTIGQYAFKECSNLTEMELPNGLVSLEGGAFSECSNLRCIEIPNGVKCIVRDLFSGCSSLTNIEIPEGVISIEDHAFQGCSSLTSIEIPSGVKSIGWYSFSGCNSLTKLEIPNGVTSIGQGAFAGCSGLRNLELPEISLIGEVAFSGSTITKQIALGKNNIELPSVFKRALVEDDILYSSKEFELTNCTIENNIIKINDNVGYASINIVDGVLRGLRFYIVYNSWNVAKNYYPSITADLSEDGILNIYGTGEMKDWEENSTTDWHDITLKNEVKQVILNQGITNIGDYAFKGCNSLSSIIIPRSVTQIGSEAFAGCDNVEIICKRGTIAETYAKEKSIKYQILEESDKITSTDYTIDEGKSVISEIKPKTTIEQIVQKLQNDMKYEIQDPKGNVVAENVKLGTGYKIKMENEKTYTLVVTGDSTGDGEADIKDILAINKHRLNKANLVGEFLEAADINGDGKSDIKDILQINKFRLGKLTQL